MPNKLGRATDKRIALVKGQVTDLLWYGKIETTLDRAKEVAKKAEKVITLAINTYQDTVTVSKKKIDASGKETTLSVINDGAKKLSARRKIMTMVYDTQEPRLQNENDKAYKERTSMVAHPLIEKIFNDYAPKYARRAEDLKQKGGYTRILKMGPRRGDAAEVAIIELV